MSQSNKNSDELDYSKFGVDAPSHDEHGSDEAIAAELGKKYIHDWRQQGARLYCIACPWEHATEPRFVDYILTGTDPNGLPLLKKIQYYTNTSVDRTLTLVVKEINN